MKRIAVHTMKLLLLLALILCSDPVLAQSGGASAPAEGDFAATGNLGFVRALDDDFDDLEVNLAAGFEYYLSDRTSVRALIGAAEFDSRRVDVDTVFISANLLRYWPSDSSAPFLTAGLGVYDKELDRRGLSDRDDTDLGVNFGGGVDIAAGVDWAIHTEAILHILSGHDPDTFLAVTVGAKLRW